MSVEGGQHIPVTGTTHRGQGGLGLGQGQTQPITMQSGMRGREQKEPLFEGGEASVQQMKKTGEQIYDKVCDVCHRPLSYPKLLTCVVLLSAFLLGAGLSAGVQRIGWFGGSRHYVSQHWDREAADAHHALDVVIDHLKHPELYRTQKSESYVHKARRSLSDLFSGILPGRSTKSYGRDLYESGRETGRDLYEKARGGLGGGSSMGAMYDRGVEQAKDLGYGLGHKISDMASSVKETIMPERGGYGDRWGEGQRGGSGSSWSSWLGGDRGEQEGEGYLKGGFRSRGEEDDFRTAEDKLRQITRQAEREM